MRNLNEHRHGTSMLGHRVLCECTRCRRTGVPQRYVERLADQSLSTALRHAQDWAGMEVDEVGRASTTVLKPIDPFIRWSAPASVSDILAKRAADFEVGGKLRAYRITRDGKEIYFGLVYGPSQSVGNRIRDHVANIGFSAERRRRSESKQLAKMLEDRRRTTMVRFADIAAPRPYRNDPKYAHAIELLLQNSLRPMIYIPSSLTFEDEDDAA